MCFSIYIPVCITHVMLELQDASRLCLQQARGILETKARSILQLKHCMCNPEEYVDAQPQAVGHDVCLSWQWYHAQNIDQNRQGCYSALLVVHGPLSCAL